MYAVSYLVILVNFGNFKEQTGSVAYESIGYNRHRLAK